MDEDEFRLEVSDIETDMERLQQTFDDLLDRDLTDDQRSILTALRHRFGHM